MKSNRMPGLRPRFLSEESAKRLLDIPGVREYIEKKIEKKNKSSACPSFAIGDEVEWDAGGAPGQYVKRGRVAEVVPAHADPLKHLGRIDERYPEIPFRSGAQKTRGHESYLVLVHRNHTRTGAPLRPLLYWPRVKSLRSVEA
jgi:hypothetical protein